MSIENHISHYTEKEYPILPGDFYISPDGNDANDGSLEHPFLTFSRAQTAVRNAEKRAKGITVCVRSGEYRTDGIVFTEEDSGCEDCEIVYRAYGDGEVTLNGGFVIPSEGFLPLEPEEEAFFREEARGHILKADLRKYGLSEKDWGSLYPFGSFGTEQKYDSYTKGDNCELFVNGQRMTVARYPNEGFLKLAAVADVGDCYEFPEQNYDYSWNQRRNHRGGKYIMDKETTARVEKWKKTDGIWAYGYFYHDWADSATPIQSFDAEHRAFYPEYVARYGARAGGQYYFHHVLDELDAPGEWYLDEKSGKLYFYPPCDLKNARVELSLTPNSVISAKGVQYITFEGFHVKGTKSDGISIHGNDCKLLKMKISNVFGNGAVLNGTRNLVSDCEIFHVGKSGIIVEGGDRQTLTPGENRVENNLFHDWGDVTQMYSGAVRLNGVGNRCSHNEMFRAPHTAVFYYGNNHIIEYNYIHDVVQHSSDAGAIYSGQNWTNQGCVIRYNLLRKIGGGEFTPVGIYFDDMLSGQTAYGNIIMDVPSHGFLIGGGRNNRVFQNMMIRCGSALSYDDRARVGFVENGWAKAAVNDYENSMMWVRLREVPYRSEVWKAQYPELAEISTDFSDPDNPRFPVNPAESEVRDNIAIQVGDEDYIFWTSVLRYNRPENNLTFSSFEEAGVDEESLTVRVDGKAGKALPKFPALPISKIGRY